MYTDINSPKTKGVNLCFQNFKNSFYIVIFGYIALHLMNDPTGY